MTVYDLDRGVKLSGYKFAIEKPTDSQLSQQSKIVFSPDGHRLVVARGVGQTVVLNADTEPQALPVLEGLEMAATYPSAGVQR